MLRRHLEEVRKNGVALDDGEFNELLACVAVPVKGPEGMPICAIGVSMLRPLMTQDGEIQRKAADHLQDAARRLETVLRQN